jgi:hypothetical protein
VCDSRIVFYTTQWKELPLKDYIDMPGMEHFFIAPEAAKLDAYNNARASLDFSLLKSDLSKDYNELVFTFTSPQNLDEASAKALEPFLKKELIYVWKDGRFALKN